MEIRIILCISLPIHALGNENIGYLGIYIFGIIYRRMGTYFVYMCCGYGMPLTYIYLVISSTIWGSDIEISTMPALGYIY
jgi:hypothetical protein